MLTKKQVKKVATKYLVKINSCGPSDWRRKVVPNKAWWLWGASLTPACINHDLKYGLGGHEQERVEADTQFRRDIETCLERHWFYRFFKWRPSVKARVRWTVIGYHRAVKFGGKSSFTYHDDGNWKTILIEEGYLKSTEYPYDKEMLFT